MPWYEDDAHSSTERHDLSCRNAEMPKCRAAEPSCVRSPESYWWDILLRTSIGTEINADNLYDHHYFCVA